VVWILSRSGKKEEKFNYYQPFFWWMDEKDKTDYKL